MKQEVGSQILLLICGTTFDLLVPACCLWVCTDFSNRTPRCFLPNSGKTQNVLPCMHSATAAAQAREWMAGPAPTCSGKTNIVISQKDSARQPGGREAIPGCQLLEHSGNGSFSDWTHLPQRLALRGRSLRCCPPFPGVQPRG